MKQFITLLILLISLSTYAQDVAVLKYNGGGDWYANLETSLPNLIKFCNQNFPLFHSLSTQQM